MRFREGDARKLPFPPDTFEVVMMLGNSFGYFETVQDDLRILKSFNNTDLIKRIIVHCLEDQCHKGQRKQSLRHQIKMQQ